MHDARGRINHAAMRLGDHWYLAHEIRRPPGEARRASNVFLSGS
jgi:hypothetical protein